MYLERLRLTGIKCFDEIEIGLSRAADDSADRQANWNVIIGDNGQGKSTLLQAAAACLVDEATASKLLRLDGWVRRREGAPRIGTIEVEIEQTAGDKQAGRPPKEDRTRYRVSYAVVDGETEIDRGGHTQFIAAPTLIEPGPDDVELFGDDVAARVDELDFVKRNAFAQTRREGNGWLGLGYGPFRRQSGFSSKAAKVEKNQERRFLTLFDEGAALYDSATWLEELKRKADSSPEESPTRATLDEVKALVVELLPEIGEVHLDDGLGFTWRGRASTLEGLSDGYRSMFVLLVDLLRWADFHRGTSETPLRDMRGVVLIDEIDAHLHPRWQREVGFLLTKAFPRLQFVVTTHSPYVAMAAGPRALHVLRTDADAVRLDDHAPSVRGWSIGRVLEALFEVDGQTDPETTRYLEEHDALRQRERHGALTLEQAARFAELEAILRERRQGESDDPRGQALHRDVRFLLDELEKRRAEG